MTKGQNIRLSDETYKKLQARKHLGQSFDGVIRELLAKVKGG